jgi:hypothetical protein
MKLHLRYAVFISSMDTLNPPSTEIKTNGDSLWARVGNDIIFDKLTVHEYDSLSMFIKRSHFFRTPKMLKNDVINGVFIDYLSIAYGNKRRTIMFYSIRLPNIDSIKECLYKFILNIDERRGNFNSHPR